MAGFSAAISTFSSCNKAGSIPLFTNHLRNYPNHYNSLIWRGHAYGIIGKRAESIADYERAFKTSEDPKKSLAQVFLEKAKGNISESKSILNKTIVNYPTCAEALFLRGGETSGNIDMTMENYSHAIREGKSQGLHAEPWYPWANFSLGSCHLKKNNTNEALECFKEAINKCETMTVAHIGISQCYYIKNNEEKAKFHFTKARDLNKNLVTWTTYEAFKHEKLIPIQQQNELKQAAQDFGSLNLSDNNKGEYVRRSDGNSGRFGGGNGGGSGDDDDEDKWKKSKKNSPCHAEYEGKIFVQSTDGKEWYVRDKAGHAGAYLKVYRDTGNSLEFSGSLDINMQPIRGKHESAKVPKIKKKDLNIRRGHIKK